MITSDQLRAARALLGLDQADVAMWAQVSLATLRRVERGSDKPRASARALGSIKRALENAGAEFIDDGVRRRRRRSPEEIAERIRKIEEIVARAAKRAAEHPRGFTEDDLYDENGLPA